MCFVVYIYMSVAVIVTVAIYVKLKKKAGPEKMDRRGKHAKRQWFLRVNRTLT